MKIDLSKISTEQSNKNTKNIDTLSSEQIAKLINKEDIIVQKAISLVVKEIGQAIDLGVKTLSKGGRIFYLGAGTSGRLGVLDASEMVPTYNIDPNLFIGIIAGGEKALRHPIEGAEDNKEQAIKDLKSHNFNFKDILIGIAASGRTPYVISGIEYAKKLKAKSIAITTAKNSEIGKIATIKIEAITGSEVITGSTRMKSGSAQKMILNMISTGIMIKMGKVYGNLMIDVKPANDKLIERTIKIVSEITSGTREEIIQALKKCDYSPKIASIMIVKKISKEQAIKVLKQNKGFLRKVLK